VGLHQWKKKLAINPGQLTPLTLARQLWPDAALKYQADDGMAVGLILADLARKQAQGSQIGFTTAPSRHDQHPARGKSTG
jgi:hypothetical protein